MGAKLDRCSGCGGFVPNGRATCPHCGLTSKSAASVAAPARRLGLGVLGGALGGGAIAFTLMACYGAPPCPDGTRECYKSPPPADTSTEPPASAPSAEGASGDAGN